MTTSWAHFTRGQLVSALRASTGGTLLAVASLAGGPWLVGSGLRGRWLWRPIGEWTLAIVCLAAILVIVTEWGLRLFLGGS